MIIVLDTTQTSQKVPREPTVFKYGNQATYTLARPQTHSSVIASTHNPHSNYHPYGNQVNKSNISYHLTPPNVWEKWSMI